MTTSRKSKFTNLDDDTEYRVELTAPVKVGRLWVRPGQPATMKGKVIKENASNVGIAQPVAD
ncbi:hypothetical protein [Oricola indica]|jgi:hypothetical protein|uniref:hypothetical protein n=1 Tax=Oricola indica TaxID=2872591 RepID=UPI001CBAF2EF|nr:hypothetical protein [Oricola indica]